MTQYGDTTSLLPQKNNKRKFLGTLVAALTCVGVAFVTGNSHGLFNLEFVSKASTALAGSSWYIGTEGAKMPTIYRPSVSDNLNHWFTEEPTSYDVENSPDRRKFQGKFSLKCPSCAALEYDNRCGLISGSLSAYSSNPIRIAVCPPSKPYCAPTVDCTDKHWCNTKPACYERLSDIPGWIYNDNTVKERRIIVGSYYAWGGTSSRSKYVDCCSVPGKATEKPTSQPTPKRAPTPKPTPAMRTKTYHGKQYPYCNSLDQNEKGEGRYRGCQLVRWGQCKNKYQYSTAAVQYSSPLQGPCSGTCKAETCCSLLTAMAGGVRTMKYAGGACETCEKNENQNVDAGSCKQCKSVDSDLNVRIKLVTIETTDSTASAPFNKLSKAGTCVIDDASDYEDCLAVTSKFKGTSWSGWNCAEAGQDHSWHPVYCTGAENSWHLVSDASVARHIWHANVCCPKTCKGTRLSVSDSVKQHLTNWGLGQHGRIFEGQVPACQGTCSDDVGID